MHFQFGIQLLTRLGPAPSTSARQLVDTFVSRARQSSSATQALLQAGQLDKLVGQPSRLYKDVVPKIGLEVHAQISTKAKLFSSGANQTLSFPNSQLDLFDIALPGTLPRLNGAALKAAIVTSLGLNCTVQDVVHFDRKNYFYIDMPAGFQITQYNKPLAKDGHIDFVTSSYHRSVIAHGQNYDIAKYVFADARWDIDDLVPYVKRARIKQIQLEQDSAKTIHHESDDGGLEIGHYVDYNRAGVALMEIVFEPDLCNHHEVTSLIKELVLVLKSLGSCECGFEAAQIRVDANVSIESIANKPVQSNSKVELKNLNSLGSLNKGVLYEIMRQSEMIKSGQEVIQETRTFQDGKTKPLRVKEKSMDYRFVPEPNIPPVRVDQRYLQSIEQELPQTLPQDLRDRILNKYSLDLRFVTELIPDPQLVDYYMIVMSGLEPTNAATVADFIIYSNANIMNLDRTMFKLDRPLSERFPPERMVELLKLVLDEKVSFMMAYELIKHIHLAEDARPMHSIAREFGWQLINDPIELERLCTDLMTNMQRRTKAYKRRGDPKILNLMINKLSELTDNRVNVRKAIEIINRKLRPPIEGAEESK